MSAQSRYRNNAKPMEVRTADKRAQVLKEVQHPMNRYQRRAMLSAVRSKRGLIVARKGR